MRGKSVVRPNESFELKVEVSRRGVTFADCVCKQADEGEKEKAQRCMRASD